MMVLSHNIIQNAYDLHDYCKQIGHEIADNRTGLNIVSDIRLDNLYTNFPVLANHRISEYIDADNRQLVRTALIISCSRTMAKKLVYLKTNRFNDNSFKYWNRITNEKVYYPCPFIKSDWAIKSDREKADVILLKANAIIDACRQINDQDGRNAIFNRTKQNSEIGHLISHNMMMEHLPVLLGGFRTYSHIVDNHGNLRNKYHVEFVAVSYADCVRLLYYEKNRKNHRKALKPIHKAVISEKPKNIKIRSMPVESIDVTSMDSPDKQELRITKLSSDPPDVIEHFDQL